MEYITQIELANFENVEPPKLERSNFSFSFSILPKEERDAINSIYAFCSYIDDIVDTPRIGNIDEVNAWKLQRLDWWENIIERIYEEKLHSPLLAPLADVFHRFVIPKQYILTIIDGCRRDLFQKRYETFEDLKTYCYSVASVVGLISIEIFGFKYEETRNYAINLGYALQLTNILRDIKSDKNRGYIYLPLEDLRRFNYSEEDLFNEVYNDNFVALMRFEASRIRELYHKARTLLHPDERMTVATAEVMDAIYYRLLEKIELNDFNIFKKRIRVSTLHKILIAMKHYLSVKMFISRIKKPLK
jgi:phytoene synthase